VGANVVETESEWLDRTYNVVEDGQAANEWRLQGREDTLSNWTTHTTVSRPKSPELLNLKVNQGIENAGQRHNRVLAFLKGRKNQFATKTFRTERYEDEGDEDGDGVRNSLVAQSMKQTRFFARMASESAWRTIESLGTSNDKLRGDNDRLRDEKAETWLVLQDLEDRKVDREIKQMREGSLTKGLDAAVSVIRSKLLGSPTKGERGSVLAEALRDLGASFTEEQLNELMAAGVLRSEQLVALMQLLRNDEADEEATVLQIEPDQLKEWKETLPPEEYKALVKTLSASKKKRKAMIGEEKEKAAKMETALQAKAIEAKAAEDTAAGVEAEPGTIDVVAVETEEPKTEEPKTEEPKT